MTTLLLLWALAQSPVSSLQGRVVHWGTTDPIANVIVELRRVEAGMTAPYVATTTSDGAFAFANVPPGQYRIVAIRPGYVNAEYGQRWPNGAGTPLTIPPGRAVSNVPIAMLQTGAITGSVRDALGRPLGNAEIQAFKATYQTGRRVLTRVQSVVSDDRGDYRLFWLAPGRYYVAARHPDIGNSVMRMGGMTIGGGVGRDGTVHYQELRSSGDNAAAARFDVDPQATAATAKEKYAPVYYPNTTDETSAGTIEVTPGSEASAIDFVVAPVPLQRVRGKVVYESNNEPAMSARVQYVTSTGASPADDPRSMFGPVASAAAVQCCEGMFELGLAPGSYTLVAAVNNLNSRTNVNVGDGDVDGVVLAIGRSFNIAGRLTFEGRVPTPAELNAFRISLAMDPPVAGLLPTSYSNVLPGGSLTLPAGRGDFRISVLPLLPAAGAFPIPPNNVPASFKDLYVKSIRLGDADVLNRGLHLEGAVQEPLDIVIGTLTGAVEGSVSNDDRQPLPGVVVALVPDVARRGRVDLMKSTSSDASGRFRLDGVPPGDYVAFALDGVEDGEWQNPEYIAAREARGTAVRVGAGTSTTTALTALAPSP